jgi:XTP/dITP diphosphohydrolase
VSLTAPRQLGREHLIIATHNAGKQAEIAALLQPFGISVVSAGSHGLPEPEETGATFLANAQLKAHAAAQASSLPSLADDSGLVVTALNGDPGIYSARWAGPQRDFHLAMEKVNARLGNNVDRQAAFNCVLVVAWPDGMEYAFEGTVVGQLVWPPRGELGFGYDPMFVADGHTITFGEMEPGAKHAISHRAAAFRQLVATCLRPEGA